jgi:hypothetical protein
MVIQNSDSRIPQDIFLWHTFGDHGDEEELEIIRRKIGEIEGHDEGFTFWTIGMQTNGKMLDRWREHLRNQSRGGFAYVALGGKARRGLQKEPGVATHFTEDLLFAASGWREVPSSINATRNDLATTMSAAFVVCEIISINEKSDLRVKWWNQSKQEWENECPPHHMRNGVKLLHKSETGHPIISEADCRHILKLQYPYFVMVAKK